jgi:PAS domain S-box-containing protein
MATIRRVTEQIVGVPVAQLVREQQAEIARLARIVQTSEQLLATLDPDTVFPQVLELARHAVPADGYALWRRDPRRGTWALTAHAGLSEEYAATAAASLGSGDGGAALDAPIVVSDVAAADWLTPEHRAAHRAGGTAAFLALPLHHGGAVIGTLVFYSRTPREFDDDDLRGAAVVANLAAAAVGTAHMYAQQEHVAEARRLLAEVSEVLATSLDYETTLANVTDVVVPLFADVCTAYVEEDGELVRVAVAHTDAETTRLYAERVPERFSVDPASNAPGIQSFLRREPIVVHDAPSLNRDLQAIGFPEDVLRRIGLGSAVAVPLVARGRALGFMLFGDRRPGRYVDDDVQMAVEIGRRTALAVDNARLYEAALERQRQLRFVAEAGEILSASLDYDTTLTNVARLAVSEFADWCIVDVIEGAEIRRLAVAARDPDQQDALERLQEEFPPTWDSPQPAARALREGRPVVIERFDPERLAETVYDDEHLELMLLLDPFSAVAVPLVARGETLGAITLAWSRSMRVYERDDVSLIEDVARRVALAVDNARLFDRERAAGERLRFLAGASSTLASSLDYEVTLENVAKLVVPRFADWCTVDALDDDGAIRRLAVVHRDPEKREWALRSRDEWAPTVDEPEGTGRVVRTGAAVLYRRISDEFLAATARSEGQLEVLRQLGMESAMVVPLTARGRTLGALMFVSADPARLYSDDDLDFAEHLARRAAAAVDNAILYRRSRELVALLDAVFATAPVGLAFFDEELRFRRVNESLAAINGMPVDEHIGRTIGELLPNLGPEAVEGLRLALAEGATVDVHAAGETPSQPGVRRFWDATYYPVRAADGEIVGLGAIVQDVTDRRRAEIALRMLAETGRFLGSSLDHRAVLQSVAEVVVPEFADWCVVHLVRGDGSIERTAAAYASDEIGALSIELDDRWTPTLRDPTGPGAVMADGEIELVEHVTDERLRMVARDPEHLEVLRSLELTSSLTVAMQARERTLGAITFALREGRRFREEDTALATALANRAALATDNALLFRELERRAQSALALAFVGDGVFLVDDAGVIRLWNTAAAVITGLASDDMVGSPARAAIPGWGAIAERAPVSRAPELPTAETIPVEVPSGERWLSISGVAFDGGTVYAFRDLTDEQRVERLKSEFVSTVSHELRTPLAAIYGAALTLRRGEPVLEAQREGLLDVIAAESDRLARIVNDILWASRVESGTLHVAVERCNAAALAAVVVDAATAHLPEKIDLTLNVEDDLPPVAADPDKVRQVLTNLIDNAIKYSPDGGEVRLDLRDGGTTVVFAVTDHGLGIPAGEEERIFDKFYRLDPGLTRGIGGTGLGLYITRELVRRMGGSVSVSSREGAGSTFSVELPIAR